MKTQGTMTQRFMMLALALALLASTASAWSQNQKAFRKHGYTSMYMPSSGPTSQTPSLTAQRMLKNPGNPRIVELSPKSSLKLSNSVMACVDSVPSFRTANGLLSPETVLRLEELTSQGHCSEAVADFLKTYRQKGPMSCIPMLSDPNVLPQLTEAMRDVCA